MVNVLIILSHASLRLTIIPDRESYCTILSISPVFPIFVPL